VDDVTSGIYPKTKDKLTLKGKSSDYITREGEGHPIFLF